MLKFGVLKKMMLQHRWQLSLTYGLFSLEMLGTLLKPFFLGQAVNDLMKGSYHGLLVLCGIHLSWLLVGSFRHIYDTRTYSAIYTSLVTRFLSRRYRQTDVSRLSAHSTLARELVDFLEFDLVYVLEAIYAIIGSMIMLYFYSSEVVLICLAVLLPVSFVSYRYGKKMKLLNRFKNDELEKQVDVITTGNTHKIREHYSRLRKWQVRISNQEAFNFGFTEIMVLLVIAFSLIVATRTMGVEVPAGDIIGIYTYLQRFVSGLDTIPYTVQRISSLSDITQRIAFETEDFPDPGGIIELQAARSEAV